ncbi:MAG: S8 family serine peptidase [Verrucomicrobiales bacterium]
MTLNTFVIFLALITVLSIPLNCPANEASAPEGEDQPVRLETVSGDGIWVSPIPGGTTNPTRPLVVKTWFDQQLLGDGTAYRRRAGEFTSSKRRPLRERVISALKKASIKSHAAAERQLKALLASGTISNLQRHWIINGFTCSSTAADIDALKRIPGVKKIFLSPGRIRAPQAAGDAAQKNLNSPQLPFNPHLYKHPWYVHSLLADRVWKEFGVTGKGTLSIIHDNNFLFPQNLTQNLYTNPNETAGNDTDDDRNGLIDDCHGYNFQLNSTQLTTRPAQGSNPSTLHGTMCAAIVCGRGTEASPYAFGIAPEGHWAGVIAGNRIESAVQWAIEQGADTYSMSFSIPNLGQMRSHWRKIMEHGSFCGLYFVSGAGNFAQSEKLPKQMRTPEDIPEAVFAAAGVQRDFSRTSFSSKGPVQWDTEHYAEGKVRKPEVCAFNRSLPLLLPDGSVVPAAISGNSFAGPMFCGAIALMLSADPDLLPWNLKEIITSTATDIGPPGIDNETGHGLINCYRAVKEVLRRKAVREGKNPLSYTGRSPGDAVNIAKIMSKLGKKQLVFTRLREGGNADKAGIKAGDVLLNANGDPVESLAKLQTILRNPQGTATHLLIERGGKQLSIRLAKGPPGIAGMQKLFTAPVFE